MCINLFDVAKFESIPIFKATNKEIVHQKGETFMLEMDIKEANLKFCLLVIA